TPPHPRTATHWRHLLLDLHFCFPLLPSSTVHRGQRKSSGAAPERVFPLHVPGRLRRLRRAHRSCHDLSPYEHRGTGHAPSRVVRPIVKTNSLTASVAIVGAIF
ncbi:hypothetical protein C8J57DRAFT_1715850, partial [Mycena rebaudengoi]